MKKPVSPVLYYWLCLCVVVLAAVFLVLASAGESHKEKFAVADIRVNTPRGYTSELTEQAITQVLEKSLSSLAGDLTIESVSTGEVSLIHVFAEQADEDRSLINQISEKVAQTRKQLPQDVDALMVTMPVNEERFVLYTFDAPNMSPAALRQFHEEEMAEQINTLSEVVYTLTLGGEENVLRICPDRFKLQAVGLSMFDLRNQFMPLRENGKIMFNHSTIEPGEIGDIVFNGKNGAVQLRDLAKISYGQESVQSFSGRMQEPGKVTGLVYYRSDKPAAECREKIRQKLEQLQAEYNGKYVIKPFETGIPQQKQQYPSVLKALAIVSIAWIGLLVLSLLAAVDWRKKMLLLGGAALVFGSIPFILHTLHQPGADDTLHLSVGLPPQSATAENANQVYSQLVPKILTGNDIADLVWFSDPGNNLQHPDRQEVHFYFKLKVDANREKTLQDLCRRMEHLIPGMVLTQFPESETGYPKQQKISIRCEGMAQLVPVMNELRETLRKRTDAEQIYGTGDLTKPHIHYVLDPQYARAEWMTEPYVMENKGWKWQLGCYDPGDPWPLEVQATDMNTGERVMIRPKLINEATRAAIYHHNGRLYGEISCMVLHERDAQILKQVLQSIHIPKECELRLEE